MAAEHPPHTSSDRNERVFLCRLEEVGAGGREVALGDRSSLFLIRRDTAVYAYHNACPHTGAPLNWGRDHFLNWDGSLIQCSFHGALFRIEDGLCVWGPCVKQYLRRAAVSVCDGDLILKESDY